MDLFLLANILMKYRKMIALIMGVSFLSTVLLCFLLPKKYTSSFVILPNPQAGIVQAPLLGPGSVSGADQALSGMNMLLIRVMEDGEFIARAMRERFIFWTDNGVNRKSLAEVYGAKDMNGAIRAGRECVHAMLNKMNGTLSLNVDSPYPELSYKVACYILRELSNHLEMKRDEYREATRSYYSSRISQARNSLAFCEEELGIFLSKNRGWDESDHPEEKLELERLKRKQDIHTSVYLDLKKKAEMEDNKINELIPPLMVIDKPAIPLIKSFPRRKAVFVKGIFLGFALAALAVVLRYEIDNLKFIG